MNRPQHLAEAEFRLLQARHILAAADPTGAGEFIWAAIVHAVSAADPGHEQQPPDRFGNPHPAPVSRIAFRSATTRISHPALTPEQAARYLDIGQSQLHNHFYHLNLTAGNQGASLIIGLQYADELLNIARHSHLHPPV